MNRLNIVIISLIVSVLATGCASIISEELVRQVDSSVTFEKVFDNPEAVKGTTVLFGGEIVSTKNLKEGALVEVVQKPLDSGQKPKHVDDSGGRFLALYDGFLDGEIYEKGRAVTVCGVVQGSRVNLLDEIEYKYPLIAAKEIHLWKQPQPPEKPFYHSPYHIWPYWYWY
ncbi:Slp family lipoprotein [uncultured Desulfobacter sp.]|uniref:Slp family lipoprotein n=1 Tax=uncultured Desulfobacter sp. TaxID=240139 RepID=UPI0029F55D1A|nr:Slp family lipoprotein [uncultured Desulfobacter sp.]